MTGAVEKYRSLALKLYKRTLVKGLRWQHDPSEDTIEAKVGGQYVGLKKTANENFEPLYVVEIRNSSAVYLDGFNDELLGPGVAPLPAPPGVTYYGLMEALFELAKRQATGADVALDQILATLDAEEEEDDVPF
jgi:hypothetical protein